MRFKLQAKTWSWSFKADDANDAKGIRNAFLAYLRFRGTPDSDYDAAEVAFGELVGNVVRHAPGPIKIQLDWYGPTPVLNVYDSGPGFALRPLLPADILRESGRGLFMVSAMTESLNVERIEGNGTHVSVVLPVRRADVPA